MKINGNIVSCAGNFALRARCKVARGTSHFVLVARLRGELRTPCSLQGCAGNFALRARCKVARGTSHFVLVASGAGNFALRARCNVARGTSLDVRHGVASRPH